MKLIIFAGGTGTRLWPLSRQNLPKQFIRMFNGKSTLELAIDRTALTFGLNNILISTNEKYVHQIKLLLPNFPVANIIAEPEKRDLAPAVGLNLMHLKKQGYHGPVALLWADHLMDDEKEFIKALNKAEKLVRKNPKQIVFVSEKPRYPNNNQGWINFGQKNQNGSYQFKGWSYKPDMDVCINMFNSNEWDWNPGYVVEDVDYALKLFKKYSNELYTGLNKIYDYIGTEKETEMVSKIYPTLPKLHHDDAIAKKVKPKDAVVIRTNMGWSDPGTLYALKEALVKSPTKNFTQGKVITKDTTDSLVINHDNQKILATIGLDGFVVVATKDATLVVKKDQILKISELVESLKSNKKLKKFI